jgi:hypothetical protein
MVPANQFERELGSLAANIARKPLSVLRTTKRQLLAIRSGAFDPRADADAMLSALDDPEALEMGREYIAQRIRAKGTAR